MSGLDVVNFSTALVILADLICSHLGAENLDTGVFLRDGFGRVAFYARTSVKISIVKTVNKEASSTLGKHVSPFGALLGHDAPGAQAVLESEGLRLKISLPQGDASIRLVDRRFFGRDWLTKPEPQDSSTAPVMVFNSIKGGVGRTTALFVLSIALSRAGKNVLLVDLDLEAPGLASLALQGAVPRFGVIDYLVETGLGGVQDEDLALFVASTDLTDRELGQGRVDVLPAAGLDTMMMPRSMMAKLARALVDAPSDEAKPQSLIKQVAEMIGRVSKRASYDVVLVDARAGLSEITASPVLGLGAINLFFGTDHAHTFEGYRYLLAHLSMLPISTESEDWRRRSFFVHAKAKASLESRESFDDGLYDVLAETFYEVDEGEEVFNFSYDDALAPHHAWRIFFSSEFIDADPVKNASLLEEDVFKGAFGSFIDQAFTMLGFREEDDDAPATI